MRTLTKTLVAVSASAALIATGTACSSSGTKPAADVKKLSGKSTSVKLDTAFVADLTALKLTPGTVGNATLDASTGTVTFPITGGHVKVYPKGKVTPYVQGSIEHNGSGLSLTSGATKVTLQNFVIDPGNHSKLTGEVLLNGAVAKKSVKLFDLNGATLQPITVDSSGVATLTGTQVKISAEAAALLDSTFKTTAVKAGLLVGVATILANTK